MAALRDQLGGALPAPERIGYAAAHRWRYASGSVQLPQACAWRAELRIGLCGDWLNGGDVQGAWLSGRALAAQILQSTQIQPSGAVHA